MPKVRVDQLAEEVNRVLMEYNSLASDDVKKACRKTARFVKESISANAPVRTGRYAASWAVKKDSESTDSIHFTVHSKNRYQIAHLLEKGHAKRGGGRVAARPHIAPAEQAGIRMLEEDIVKALEK